MSSNGGIDKLLKENKILVCVGSGGVGKTTLAAAIGIRARQLGLRAFVLTVDPAKRLATSMGLDLTAVEERVVPATKPGAGSLVAAIIDSKKVFDEFIIRYSTDPDLIKRLSRNRLYQQLSTTLSGSQEFTALERLLQAYESTKFDIVILDTPPTQHALDFLSAPERIRSLFQDSITKWFMNPDDGSLLTKGLIGSIIGKGTRAALKSLEVLTGGKFIEELVDFFSSMRSIQKTLRDRSDQVHKLLISPEAKFVLVTSFDAAKLLEAQHLSEQLDKFGYRLGGCILNRAFPESLPDFDGKLDQVPESLTDAANRLRAFHARVKADHQTRFKLFQEFEGKVDGRVAVLRVPEYRQDLFGLEDLESLAQFLGES